MPNNAPKAELATKIVAHLRETEGDRLSEDALPAFSAALADEHLKLIDEESGKRDHDRVIDPSLTEHGVVYPIHNSDLKLMDESTAIAGALWTVTNNPIGVLGKLVALLYRLRRKRARLEGEQALALLALKEAPRRGWTVAQVRDHLKQAFGVTLPEDRVLTLLKGLKDVRLSDDTSTDFADERDGLWFKVDV